MITTTCSGCGKTTVPLIVKTLAEQPKVYSDYNRCMNTQNPDGKVFMLTHIVFCSCCGKPLEFCDNRSFGAM